MSKNKKKNNKDLDLSKLFVTEKEFEDFAIISNFVKPLIGKVLQSKEEEYLHAKEAMNIFIRAGINENSLNSYPKDENDKPIMEPFYNKNEPRSREYIEHASRFTNREQYDEFIDKFGSMTYGKSKTIIKSYESLKRAYESYDNILRKVDLINSKKEDIFSLREPYVKADRLKGIID